MADDAGKQLSPQMQQFLIKQQAEAQMQQLAARLTDECWDVCISSPGDPLQRPQL
jgi:import inner membrane translocase subunit TIM8